MSSCITIEGGKVDGDGVRSVTEAVLLILESPHNDQKTKRLALETISRAVSAEAPSNISIHGSNFSYHEKPELTNEEIEDSGENQE
jgi:hypothetical protein